MESILQDKIDVFFAENEISVKKDVSTKKLPQFNIVSAQGLDREVFYDKLVNELDNVVKHNKGRNGDPDATAASETTPWMMVDLDGDEIILYFKPTYNASASTRYVEEGIADFLVKFFDNQERLTMEDLAGINVGGSWVDSFNETAQALYDFIPPAKRDIVVSREGYSTDPSYPSIHMEIIDAMIRTGEYKSSERNSWNPSDIYVCYKGAIDEFLTKLNAIETIADLNFLLDEYLQSREIIGVSLKKIGGKTAKIEYRGYTYTAQVSDTAELVSSIKVPGFFDVNGNPIVAYNANTRKATSSRMDTSSIAFNFKEGDKVYEFKYRPFSTTNVQLELGGKGENARFGKVPKKALESVANKFGIYEISSVDGSYNFYDEFTPMVNKIVSSGLPISQVNQGKVGTLNINDWINYANAVDKNEYEGEEVAMIKFWPTYIKFLYMLASSYSNGDDQNFDPPSDGPGKVWTLGYLLNYLASAAAKNTESNAPYIIVH